ncbi:hypothetical protein BKA69DRAFT_1076542, partial [Paraphysoderma sedebokerense]
MDSKQQYYLVAAREYHSRTGEIFDEFTDAILENNKLKELLKTQYAGMGAKPPCESALFTDNIETGCPDPNMKDSYDTVYVSRTATAVSNQEHEEQQYEKTLPKQKKARTKKTSKEQNTLKETGTGGTENGKPLNKGHKACVDCGTTTSPEWRRGPQGSKTFVQ